MGLQGHFERNHAPFDLSPTVWNSHEWTNLQGFLKDATSKIFTQAGH